MINITELKKMLLSEVEEKELSPKQKKIAGAAEPKDKITGADFAALRGKKGVKKEVKLDYDFNEDELEKIVQTLKRHHGTLVNPISAMEKALGKNIPAFNDVVNEDHEVSMAHNSLESIIKSAMELKAKLGNDERNIPGWIQDHITNAENYIDQASQGFHELSPEDQGEADFDELPDGTEEEPVDDEHNMSLAVLMEDILGEDDDEDYYGDTEIYDRDTEFDTGVDEAKKKPSAGLTKKQKSAISKKAKAGKDIGKKGKGFEKIAKAAAEKYGSKERGQKVAAAAMWKSAAKKAK